jgi:hypothetical protein
MEFIKAHLPTVMHATPQRINIAGSSAQIVVPVITPADGIM